MPEFIENILIGIRQWVTGIIDEKSYVIASHLTELHEDKENNSNKVTSISSSSTDAQYPSAKCVYDEFEDTITTQVVDSVSDATLNIGVSWSLISGKPDLSTKVDKTTTVNGYPLSSNVTVTTNDVSPEIISHGTSDTGTSANTYAISPNKLHTWGSVTALYLSFDTPISGVVNEYMIRFTADTNFSTLSLPYTIRWSVVPTIVDGNTYEISIIDNLAICAEY